jgi:hypothetical protein
MAALANSLFSLSFIDSEVGLQMISVIFSLSLNAFMAGC